MLGISSQRVDQLASLTMPSPPSTMLTMISINTKTCTRTARVRDQAAWKTQLRSCEGPFDVLLDQLVTREFPNRGISDNAVASEEISTLFAGNLRLLRRHIMRISTCRNHSEHDSSATISCLGIDNADWLRLVWPTCRQELLGDLQCCAHNSKRNLIGL